MQATHPTFPTEQYSYDPVGNRLGTTVDANNRLLEDTDYLYQYDNNGNLTQKTHKTTGEITTFVYDTENRLVQVSKPGITALYKYDPFGRRIEKSVNGILTKYLYDNEDIVLEYDGAGQMVASYTHGPGIDEPLSMERPGQEYYYHQDGLGSVTALTNNSGDLAQRYEYDSYGKIVTTLDPNLTQPFSYTGREYDEETGLYYYRARYYDADAGRFISEDPIGLAGGDVNYFAYVGNNPVHFVDPLGLAVGDWWDLPANFQRAQEIARQELQNRPSGHNDAEDAMRHAVWNSRMVHETNTFTAWVAGVGHEIEGLSSGQPWGEAMMDLHNNAVGRAAGGHSPITPNVLRTSPTNGSQYNPYDRDCQK